MQGEAVSDSVPPQIREPSDSAPFLKLRFFGWNIGGAAVEELPELLRTFESSLEEAVILLQECPRKQTGWYTQGLDGWRLVSHSASDQWRGTGIMFRPAIWAVVTQRVVVQTPTLANPGRDLVWVLAPATGGYSEQLPCPSV